MNHARIGRLCLVTTGWLLLLGLLGCGAVRSEPAFQGLGEADLERDAAVIETYEATVGDEAKREDIRVLLDTLPVGIKLSEGSFGVEEGYNHQMIGKFALGPGANLFWFNDFEAGWRKGLCYWQVPLTWLTLTLWWAVPTFYPCFPSSYRTKLAVTRDAKTLAAAAGADTVIMGFLGGDQEDTLGAAGLMIRLDPEMKGKIETKPIKPEDFDTARRVMAEERRHVGAAKPSRCSN